MSETLYLILRSVKIRYAFKLAVAMPLSWLLQCLQIGCCYAFKYAVAMIVCCRRVHIMFNLYRTHVRTLLSAILYLIYLVLQYWISVSGKDSGERLLVRWPGDSVAQWLIVRTVSERTWVRAPVEPPFYTCSKWLPTILPWHVMVYFELVGRNLSG